MVEMCVLSAVGGLVTFFYGCWNLHSLCCLKPPCPLALDLHFPFLHIFAGASLKSVLRTLWRSAQSWGAVGLWVLVCRCAGRQSRCYPQAHWDWSRCFDRGQINTKPKSKSKHLCKCSSTTNLPALHWWGQSKHTLLRDRSLECHPRVLTLTLVCLASTPLSFGDLGDTRFTVKLVMGWQKIAYVSVMLLVVRLCVVGTGTGTKVQTIVPTWFGFSRSVL